MGVLPLGLPAPSRSATACTWADGLALWERYNLAALSNLVGTPTYVCNYESLVDHPEEQLHALAAWVDGLPQFAGLADGAGRGTAVRSISPPEASGSG